MHSRWLRHYHAFYMKANIGIDKRVNKNDGFATEFALEVMEYVPHPKLMSLYLNLENK